MLSSRHVGTTLWQVYVGCEGSDYGNIQELQDAITAMQQAVREAQKLDDPELVTCPAYSLLAASTALPLPETVYVPLGPRLF